VPSGLIPRGRQQLGETRANTTTFEMLFERARLRTGIARLHSHLLRHTYGTRSSELGIPTLTLQRFMGYSQPKVTERYSHVATNERRTGGRGLESVGHAAFLNTPHPTGPAVRRSGVGAVRFVAVVLRR
jgi:hypothetical protein